ncbi:MAG: alcohol dehydrogenase catalytic domain-containing protein, partial [Gemmatimonadota bacterium]|nr:alcohol dehydrogenase catalytic domain-containing protein [Gemmatimonadota bacterium]
MRAMILRRLAGLDEHPDPLELVDLPVPEPAAGELLVRVSVCGVCHTELDEIEGRMPPPGLPVVPGHQIVGTVEGVGPGVSAGVVGSRV